MIKSILSNDFNEEIIKKAKPTKSNKTSNESSSNRTPTNSYIYAACPATYDAVLSNYDDKLDILIVMLK